MLQSIANSCLSFLFSFPGKWNNWTRLKLFQSWKVMLRTHVCLHCLSFTVVFNFLTVLTFLKHLITCENRRSRDSLGPLASQRWDQSITSQFVVIPPGFRPACQNIRGLAVSDNDSQPRHCPRPPNIFADRSTLKCPQLIGQFVWTQMNRLCWREAECEITAWCESW